jgi:hypothetical protein
LLKQRERWEVVIIAVFADRRIGRRDDSNDRKNVNFFIIVVPWLYPFLRQL